MPPEPADDIAIDPEDRDYFSYNWGSLPWSDWVPFSADKYAFHAIPHEPGVYRIRPGGKDFLMYVGETSRSLHQRLNELRQNLRRSDLMPWSDPHAEAPALWAYWVEWASATTHETPPQRSLDNAEVAEEAGQVMLECSAAPLDASPAGRKGMENFLLYKYRQERGESPLCNFGRFHPRYRKSTTRKEGRRGKKLADDQKDNPAGFPSIKPLEATGAPGDRDWMGLEWTVGQPLAPLQVQEVAAGAGLYLLADAGSHEIVYIGQSADVGKRLLDHAKKTWEGRELAFSYQIIGQAALPHNLRELENDLTGNFFTRFKKAPAFQFRSGT